MAGTEATYHCQEIIQCLSTSTQKLLCTVLKTLQYVLKYYKGNCELL